MAKAPKTLRIRVDPDDYAFLSRLAVAEHADLSKTVRDLVKRGRVLLAVERYRAGSLRRQASPRRLVGDDTVCSSQCIRREVGTPWH